MVFVETSLFTKLLADYLSDEEYAPRRRRHHQGLRPRQEDSLARGWQGQIRRRASHLLLGSSRAPDLHAHPYGKGEKEDLSSADLEKVVRLLAEMTSD